LPYHEREVLVQFAIGDFLCCGLDCFRHLGIESVLYTSASDKTDSTSALTIAAACLRIPPARINGSGILRLAPASARAGYLSKPGSPILKFCRLR
jgi:hypothetical protein